MLTDPTSSTSTRPATEWALTAGLVAIFLANAIGAVVEPDGYRHILEASPLTRVVGLHRHSWATTLIAVNDAAIAAALVVSVALRRTRHVTAIAGGWLALAALLKLTASVAG